MQADFLSFHIRLYINFRNNFLRNAWTKFSRTVAGKEHNFNKYNNRTVTDYGIGYDYKSVMHYSSHAFSKNGEPTITPKVIIARRIRDISNIVWFALNVYAISQKEKIKLGQRDGLSEKDVAKVRAMYKEQCGDRNPEGSDSNLSASFEEISAEWIFD